MKTSIKALLSVILFVSLFAKSVVSQNKMSYTIKKLWDSRCVAEQDHVLVKFEYVENSDTNTQDLQIEVQAPFYNDPHINDTVPKGSMDKLWEYEVVEVFLLGSDERYLELEFSPKEQYLFLQLHGYRNVVKTPLYISNYSAKIDGKQWSGKYVIPSEYIPSDVDKFNAYAIHGTDDARQYLALFPTPFGKFKEPDFHRLDYFQKFEL